MYLRKNIREKIVQLRMGSKGLILIDAVKTF